MAEVPLINDYDFTNFSDENLEKELAITQAILNQVTKMIAENNRQINLSDDVNGRTRLVGILTVEQDLQNNKKLAIQAEMERRENE